MRLAERQCLEKIDPPIQKDPLGNAIIGGGVGRRAWVCRRGRSRDRHGHRDWCNYAEGSASAAEVGLPASVADTQPNRTPNAERLSKGHLKITTFPEFVRF